jgi:hypothetical protein
MHKSAFLLPRDRTTGEANGRRGGGQAMGPGPLVHGKARGGGQNGEEAEGV